MIEIFDKTRWRVAIAENAHNISEQQKINAVWYLYFSIPYKDPKNEYYKPFYYVRHNGGELYRIMPETLEVDEAGSVAYQCEHVLATLCDNVLFGYHVVGNLGTYTADMIRYVLNHQLEKTGFWMNAITEINLNTAGSRSLYYPPCFPWPRRWQGRIYG